MSRQVSRTKRDIAQKLWMERFSTRERAWAIRHKHELFTTRRFDLEYLRANLWFVQPDGLRASGHYKTPDCICEVRAYNDRVGGTSRTLFFDLIVYDRIVARTENKIFALNWLYLKLVRAQVARAA